MKNTLILAACNIQISAKTHISEFATKPFETKMEVDSDSEQPSGSGTVSKDKKRWVPVLLSNARKETNVASNILSCADLR